MTEQDENVSISYGDKEKFELPIATDSTLICCLFQSPMEIKRNLNHGIHRRSADSNLVSISYGDKEKFEHSGFKNLS